MLKLSHDTNGNKICSLIGDQDRRGFSVQTLGNMPETHRMTYLDFNKTIALNELNAYIKEYGTDREKDILGVIK